LSPLFSVKIRTYLGTAGNFKWVRFCTVPWSVFTEVRLFNGPACIWYYSVCFIKRTRPLYFQFSNFIVS